jgi:hypothetical protein
MRQSRDRNEFHDMQRKINPDVEAAGRPEHAQPSARSARLLPVFRTKENISRNHRSSRGAKILMAGTH